MKSWSKCMPTLCLSTGEAELGALVRGAVEAEGVKAFLGDFGIQPRIVIKSDAAAAVGMTRRLGLGRVRHLAVSDLWIQQRVRQGGIEIEKTPGITNPADAFDYVLGRTEQVWPAFTELLLDPTNAN